MIKDYLPASQDQLAQDEAGFVEAYWTGKLGDGLGRDALSGIANREEWQPLLAGLEGLPAGARILDGGCGCGEWTVALAEKGFAPVGLDISEALIGRLQTLFPGRDFLRGDLRALPFADASFDAVFSWGAFEHFEIGLAPCLSEAFRLLKPGGRLLITVPFASRRVQRLLESNLLRDHTGSAGRTTGLARQRFYQWRFTRGEVTREANLAGFAVEHTRPMGLIEGLRRMVRNGMPLAPPPGSVPEVLLLRLLRHLVPASYCAHMIYLSARKPA